MLRIALIGVFILIFGIYVGMLVMTIKSSLGDKKGGKNVEIVEEKTDELMGLIDKISYKLNKLEIDIDRIQIKAAISDALLVVKKIDGDGL